MVRLKSCAITVLKILLFLVIILNLKAFCFANNKHLPNGSFNANYIKHKEHVIANAKPTAFSDSMTPMNKWMSYLKDDALLTNINIPGTHDSGTKDVKGYIPSIYDRAQCQDLYIDEQLNQGIRHLDIRSTDTGLINHGGFYCRNKNGDKLYFSEVLQWVTNFLKNNPSECVLLNIQSEKANKNITSMINDTINKNASDFIFDANSKKLNELQLRDVRGKIVVISSDADEIFNKSYFYKASPGGSVPFCNLLMDKKIIGYKQNNYSAGSAEEKAGNIKNFYTTWKEKGRGITNELLINTTSFWTFKLGRGIKSLRDELFNEKGIDFYLRSRLEEKLGVILFDFPDSGRIYTICRDNKYRNEVGKNA